MSYHSLKVMTHSRMETEWESQVVFHQEMNLSPTEEEHCVSVIGKLSFKSLCRTLELF